MMNRLSILILSAAAFACTAANSSFDTYDNYMKVVAQNMRETHATLDGQRILDAKPHGTCEASIITPGKAIVVRWKDFGNLSPYLLGDKTVYELYAPEGKHTFLAPSRPEAMNPMHTIFGLLDDECWDKAQHTRNFKWGS